MINKNNAKILLFVLIGLLIIGIQEPVQKQAVADVEGQSCSVDTDCQCFGKIEGTNITAYGIGASNCEKGKCDTTFCVDVQPIGEFIRDKPYTWLKNNPIMIIWIIGLILLVAYWPKV